MENDNYFRAWDWFIRHFSSHLIALDQWKRNRVPEDFDPLMRILVEALNAQD